MAEGAGRGERAGVECVDGPGEERGEGERGGVQRREGWGGGGRGEREEEPRTPERAWGRWRVCGAAVTPRQPNPGLEPHPPSWNAAAAAVEERAHPLP